MSGWLGGWWKQQHLQRSDHHHAKTTAAADDGVSAPLLAATLPPTVVSGDGGGPAKPATGTVAKAGRIGVPEDFDWRSYLLRYSDLRTTGVRTRAAALAHYVDNGYKEQRSYQRIPVLLRYTACQGLFNQLYAHLNALVLADHLGADVVLPPSVYRESFAKYFSMDEIEKNEVKWTPTHQGALLDVEALRRYYAKKGGWCQLRGGGARRGECVFGYKPPP